jgi:hypothetical protein
VSHNFVSFSSPRRARRGDVPSCALPLQCDSLVKDTAYHDTVEHVDRSVRILMIFFFT